MSTEEIARDFLLEGFQDFLSLERGSAVNTTTAPTNPQYSGNVLVNEYNPIEGAVGDLGTTSVSWPGAGALTRATS